MGKEFRFIIDTQLPPVLAAFFRREGYDAVHTTAFNKGHLLAAETIRQIAVQQERIVVTKDTDLPEYFL